jgi:hypothetical protein
MTPTETILDHLPAVRAAFKTCQGSASGAWKELERTCPEVAAGMALNSFKVIAPAVLATADRLQPPPLPHVNPPGNFQGWTVGQDAKDRIRLHRRVDGRLRSIYIGRPWNPEKAAARIAAFEALHSSV